MDQFKIKNRFTLTCWLAPFLCAVLSKVLYLTAAVTGSDIYFTGAASIILRSVPFICKYAYVVFGQLFYATAAALAVYSVTYFGRKTAVSSVLASLCGFISGEILIFIYNLLRNSLSGGQLVSAFIASFSQLLYAAAVLIVAVVSGSFFLKKSFTSPLRHRMKAYSPYKAALIPIALRAFLQIADVTIFNVIPFFMEYDDIRPNELTSIILDYAYYIGVYFILTAALTLLFMLLLRGITGQLKPKFNGGLQK